mgnify:CR=1 FL=1
MAGESASPRFMCTVKASLKATTYDHASLSGRCEIRRERGRIVSVVIVVIARRPHAAEIVVIIVIRRPQPPPRSLLADLHQRRKAQREQRKTERARAVGGLSRVFTFNAMFKNGKRCCNGVRWKNSVQRFELHLFSETAKRRRELFAHKWMPGKYVHFQIHERGKVRPISAPKIQDRQVHKTLTRGALMPLYLPDMIYENGASLPDKGLKPPTALARSVLRCSRCAFLRWYLASCRS